MTLLAEASAARATAPALPSASRTATSAGAAAAAPLAAGAAAEHLPVVNAVRILAALAVTWVHTVQSPELAATIKLSRFGTPFFTALAVFLLFRTSSARPQRGFRDYAWGRFKRLYLPFIVWSALYYAGSALHHLLVTGEPVDPLYWGQILYGVPAQLWFLPFCLGTLLVFFPATRLAARLSGGGLTAFCLAMVAAGVACGLVPPAAPAWADKPARGFLELGWLCMPAAFWGAALGASYRRWPDALRRSRWLLAVGAALLLAGEALAWQHGPLALIKCAAGIGCLAMALTLRTDPVTTAVGRIGAYGFCIYVMHPMFVEAAQSAARAAGMAATWHLDVLVLPVAVGGSIALAKALRLSRATAWLVP